MSRAREILRGSGLTVFAVRLLLLLGAIALAAGGLSIAFRDAAPAADAPAAYVCPMHPEVTAASPGQCPICKMALEPTRPAGDSTTHGAMQHESEHPPDCPMHAKPKQTSKKTVAEPSAEFAPGVTWIPEAHPAPERSKPGDGPLLAPPKRREFKTDVRAWAWLEEPERASAVLYRDELVGLSPGLRAKFFRAKEPRAALEVVLTEDAPEPWDGATSLVRFAVEPSPKDGAAPHDAVEAGDVGWLELGDMTRELLAFPEPALLRSEQGPYVLVASDDGRSFTRRPIQIGRILKGQVIVLGGLREDERIVQSNAFFLDAEQAHDPDGARTAEVAP